MSFEERCASRGQPQALAQLQLGGRRLQVVCVDDVVPVHTLARDARRPRLSYVDGEVAHFELDGHRYAIALERVPPPQPPAGDEDPGPLDIHRLLTNRELQIVQLICMGCLTKQVADKLRISEFTVRSYLKTVYCKLGVRSRGAMVYRYAQSFKQGEPGKVTPG